VNRVNNKYHSISFTEGRKPIIGVMMQKMKRLIQVFLMLILMSAPVYADDKSTTEPFGLKEVRVGMTLETVKSLHKKYPKKLGGNIKCKLADNILRYKPETVECKPLGSTSIAGFKSEVIYSFYKQQLKSIVVSYPPNKETKIQEAFTKK